MRASLRLSMRASFHKTREADSKRDLGQLPTLTRQPPSPAADLPETTIPRAAAPAPQRHIHCNTDVWQRGLKVPTPVHTQAAQQTTPQQAATQADGSLKVASPSKTLAATLPFSKPAAALSMPAAKLPSPDHAARLLSDLAPAALSTLTHPSGESGDIVEELSSPAPSPETELSSPALPNADGGELTLVLPALCTPGTSAPQPSSTLPEDLHPKCTAALWQRWGQATTSSTRPTY
jgi:hypothetical protein